MFKIIKKLGGRKFVAFFITMLAVIVFPKQATYLMGVFGLYVGGNGIVSLAWKK